MWQLPEARLCDYIVRCKGCGENIPAPCADAAEFMDCDALSTVRRSASLPAHRHLPWAPVAQADDEADDISKAGVVMGEMHRAISREEQERKKQDRFSSTLVIAAAVRLAHDDISRPSPMLTSVVADSVQLARTILEKIVR